MAINNNNDLKLVLELDNKGALKAVKQFDTAIDNTGTKGASSIGKLNNKFVKLGVAVSAISLVALGAGIASLARRGAEIDGLAKSFEALQTQAGSNATASIEKLRKATMGLVSDFDLMKSANNAVLLGLPTEGFDKLAESATKLGLATGRTAVEALNDLVTGVGRGSKLILDNLGILVDSTQAYKNYARSIDVSVDALTEQQKKQAFQAEAFEQIKNKSQELSDVTLTAGNVINSASISLQNLTDKLAQTANNSEFLKSVFLGLNAVIQNLDATVSYFTTSLDDIKSDALNKSLQANVASANAFVKTLKEVKNTAGDFAKELQPKLVHTAKEIAKVQAEIVKVQNLEIDPTRHKALQKTLSALNKEYNIYLKALKDIQAPQKKSNAELAKAKKETDKYTIAMKSLEDTLKVITGSAGFQQYDDQLEKITRRKKQGAITNEEYTQAIKDIADEADFTADQLKKFEDRVKKIDQEVRQAKTGLEQLFGQGNFIGEALSGTGLGDTINSIASTLGEEVSSELASGLQGVFGNLLEGGDVKESAKDLGGVLGGAVGGKFGEAYGKKIGESISGIGSSTGETVKGIATILTGGLSDLHGAGDFLAGAFGGNKDAGANARSGFEKYIREVLDEKPLQLVIDDQLQKLDFNITGGRDAFDGGGLFNTAFEGLSENAVAQFSGIGESIAQLMNNPDLIGSQVGAILADNVGGSLNNLQIMMEQLGYSSEQLKDSMRETWLDGKTSANEALSAFGSIDQVMSQGLPDGVGLLDQAFKNLKESAGSGRLVLDALGDIAVEASEKGIGSLDEAIQSLIESGADAGQVEVAFQAIKDAGITSLEALKNVSVDSAIQISSALENTPDFFDEKVAKLDEIQDKLNNIENKEVDIKFNFKSDIDEGTERAITAGAFNSSGIGDVGVEGVV